MGTPLTGGGDSIEIGACAPGPGLRALRRAAIQATRGAYAPLQLEAWAALDPWSAPAPADAAAGEDTLVARAGGEPVGLAVLRGDEIAALYVLPDWQGRGVGSRLLRALEELARARGESALCARASLNAAPFYQQHGYRAIARPIALLGDAVAGVAVEFPTVLVRKAF